MNKNKQDLQEIKKGATGYGLLIENDGYISADLTQHNKQLKESFDESDEWFVPKPFIVDAILQKYDVKNANGRIYPEAILKREVEKYQERIKNRNAYGELNHPSDSTIDLGRISHNIIELHWVGKTLVGKMELNISEGFRRNGICSTMGDSAAMLLLNGYLIGVSSRAVGSVEQRLGQTIVGDDLEIICWDIVSDNSTPGAKISMNGPEELQQYIESDNTKKNKSKLDEKLSKVEQILKG